MKYFQKALTNLENCLKDFSINEDVAYHGTPHNFDNFSLKFINSGEGAQVHGWGIYFALDKDIAKNYKSKLSNLWDQKYKSFDKEQREWLKQLDKNGYEKTLQAAEDDLVKFEKEYETAEDINSDDEDDSFFRTSSIRTKNQVSKDIQKIKRKIDFIKSLNGKSIQSLADISGTLYTVDVPSLDTMIDEQKSLVNQSTFVQKVIRNDIFKPNIFNVLTYLGLVKFDDFYDEETRFKKEYNLDVTKREWDICVNEIYKESKIGYNDYNLTNSEQLYKVLKLGMDKTLKYALHDLDIYKELKSEDIAFYENKVKILNYINENILKNICEKYDSFLISTMDNITGKEIYNLIVHSISMLPEGSKSNVYAKASMLLLKYGIQGIKYNGLQDGECVVIFNPKRIKIVGKE